MGEGGLSFLLIEKMEADFPSRLVSDQWKWQENGWPEASANISEREHIQDELRKALDEVNALTGLLSICASCKKARDESGNWQRLESYIQSHSEAKFTHGGCEGYIRNL